LPDNRDNSTIICGVTVHLIFACSTWGMESLATAAVLRMIKDGGFDAVEMGAPVDPGERSALRSMLDELGLDIVAQQWTQGTTPTEHIRSFEEQFKRSLELRPLLVNSHTGVDYYAAAENVTILEFAAGLERRHGVPLVHEIHRGRATFSTMSTMALLDAVPSMKLTADFSHWCCVHESFLENQAAAVRRAIERSHHIHARVGHPEGPQVSDPRAPEWQDALETHIRWWQAIVDRHRNLGSRFLTVCPEFGPPGYMPTLPFTRQPVGSQWEINLFMKEVLQRRLVV
jgi:sugar phosphate isomerase/epimerase